MNFPCTFKLVLKLKLKIKLNYITYYIKILFSGFPIQGPLPSLIRPINLPSPTLTLQQQQEPSMIDKDETFDEKPIDCYGEPYICGEAACQQFDDNTSRCICPHDKSPPTADLKCPNRMTGWFYLKKYFFFFFVPKLD